MTQKLWSILLAALLALTAFTGCRSNAGTGTPSLPDPQADPPPVADVSDPQTISQPSTGEEPSPQQLTRLS